MSAFEKVAGTFPPRDLGEQVAREVVTARTRPRTATPANTRRARPSTSAGCAYRPFSGESPGRLSQ